MRKHFLGLCCCLMMFSVLRAEEHIHAHGGAAFVENRGQWEDVIRFKSGFRGGALFFEQHAVTFALQDREQVEEIMGRKFSGPMEHPATSMVDMYAYRVRFVGALPSCHPQGSGLHSEYHNYYLGNDPRHWAAGVPLYDTLCYWQLYEGVDLKYYFSQSSYKYEFDVSPGTHAAQIRMRYEGARRISLKKDNLLLKIGKYEVVELKPYAYQLDASGHRMEVKCGFLINGDEVSFRLGDYDRELPLVIDPVVVFCSYTGSFADNWGYTATYDRYGNMYGGGAVFENGYPCTVGTYQMDYGGGSCDIAITKFSGEGNSVLFSTYLGGSRSEVPHSLVVNGNDELYVLASTSSRNYPVTDMAYDTVFCWSADTFILTNVIYYAGGIDIAISKFSADGKKLEGSTYFGGNGADGLSTDVSLRKNYADEVRGEIMVDAYSNVYIVSSTASTDLPTSSSVFQSRFGGGRQDGCIAKFSYDLRHLIWCSYIGGDSSDAAYSMVLDKENNVYLCGGTRSRHLPVSVSAVQKTYGGGVSDGFVACISTNGNELKALTYMGKEGYDQTYLIKMDQNGDVFLLSLTDAPDSSWVVNAQWYIWDGGQVITKLNSSLSKVIWSTAFGTGFHTGPDISPTALMVDLCHQVYVSGWGSPSVNAHVGYTRCGTRGLPISSDAFSVFTDDNDFYFLSLNSDASNLRFGTYFGGRYSSEHVDGGTSRFDRKGYIYQAICASCGGYNDLPVTPGVANPLNNSYNCNLGVVKIDFNLKEVVADFTMPNVVCSPYVLKPENFSRVVSDSTTSVCWDFGDGTLSHDWEPIHLYHSSGTYRVRLIVTDTASCNGSDTLECDLIVLSNTLDTLPDKYICKGDFVQIGIQPASSFDMSYSWTPSEGLSSTSISNPIASDTVSRTYYLTLTDGVCVDTFRIRVHVVDVSLDAGPDRVVCAGDTLHLQASGTGGDRFVWSVRPDFSDTLNASVSVPDLVLAQWVPGIYHVLLQNAYCSLKDSVKVDISQVRIRLPDDFQACGGDTVCLQAQVFDSVNKGNLYFHWEPSDKVLYEDTAGKVCVRVDGDILLSAMVENNDGCRFRDTVKIQGDFLQLQLLAQHIRCHGERNGVLEARVLSGIPPYTYQWMPNAVQASRLENLAAGRYSLKVTDSLGCEVQEDTAIQEPEKISISILDSNLQVFCDGRCDGHVSVDLEGGVPPYDYHWITGDTSRCLSGLCAGQYRFFVCDARQCRDTLAVEVRDTSGFSVSYQVENARCAGSCDGSLLLNPKGVSPYTYHWSIGYQTAYVRSLCAGVYDVVVQDARHCSRRVFPKITEPEPLRIDSLLWRAPLCHGDSDGFFQVFVSGASQPYRYFWNGVEGTALLSRIPAGSYHLKIMDSSGCEKDTLLHLTQYDSLLCEIDATKVPCREVCNAEAEVSVSGGMPPYTYLWDGDDTSATVGNLCYGTHSCLVTDGNGCTRYLTFSVEDSSVFPQDIKAWADAYTIYDYEKTLLHVTDLGDAFHYQWAPAHCLRTTDESTVEASPKDTIVFTVTVTDSFGCARSDTVGIRVLHVVCDNPYVYVPNSFTPNGDGVNDVLYVRGPLVESLYFAVYDRWGEKVFETAEQSRGWDGTFRGKACEQGVYVYYLEVRCKGGSENLMKGNVTLIR